MYTPGPTPEEADAYGLTVEEATRVVEVWPDNWPAVCLMATLRTQWRVGASGATGLDYSAIEPAIRLCGLQSENPEALFADLQVLEDTALDLFAKRRK